MGSKIIFFKKNFWIILIFILAIFLRTYKLDIYPEAVDEDEMSLGYISYSLFKNGTDEHGNKFPIYFESVGDYKYGLYSYFEMLPISIFGLNTISTRIMASIFGSLSVLVIYFLALEIIKDKKFALASAFVLAINPTHIHFSRVAYNNIMGAFFALFCTYCLIKVLKKYDLKYLLGVIFLFLLSIFSYQAFRLVLPAIIILISAVFVNKKNYIKLLLLNSGLILIVALSFLPAESRARSQNLSILINTPAMVESFSEDNLAGSKLLTTRIFHNKVIDFSLGLTGRYTSYFDPKFFFLETNQSVERHATPNIGLLYLIELPLMLLSLFALSRFKTNKLFLIPFILIITAPLGASMVLEARSTTRSVFLVYGTSILLGFGIYYLSQFKKYINLILISLFILYLGNFAYFYHQYTVHKIYHHPWNSDVGLKEMSISIMNNYINRYEKVVVSKGHYIPFLFYSQSDPNDFLNKKGMFSKIIFGMPYDCPSIGKPNVLYVCFGYKVPKASNIVEVFRYRDSQPAIILVDFNDKPKGLLPEKVEWGEEIPNIKLDEKDYWPTNNFR